MLQDITYIKKSLLLNNIKLPVKMKKILLLILFSTIAFSQNKGAVTLNVEKLVRGNAVFSKFDIFTENKNFENKRYQKTVDSATIVKIDKEKINQIVAQKPDLIEIEFPLNNQKISVLLYKVEIQADGYNVQTNDNQKNIALEKGVHYRGIVKNESHSVVAFNFFPNQMSAIVSHDKNNNIVIDKLDIEKNTDDYIVYSDNNLKSIVGFTCSTPDSRAETPAENKILSPQSARCVTMYFEMGYSLYTARGSNLNQCNIWMNSVFNNVQTLYSNDGLSVALKTLYVWTTPDPYVGTSSSENLNLFVETRPFFNGDLGQLLISKGGQGGVAQTINGICKTTNYSFSDVSVNYNTVPLYSWTIEVITHEFGHLMGSPHTHGCYWNNNNTAIDGCAPTYNITYKEGNCAIGPVPSSTVKGTIMSYCHLVNGVGINFANGFGPQPAARVLAAVNAGTCLSTDCINTCISVISNLKATNINNTSATISFTDNDLSGIQWEIAVTPYPFTSPVFSIVSSTSTTINNLEPNTYYSFSVRPKCSGGTTAIDKKIFFATTDNFCSGKIFTDSGGASNEYGNLEFWTRTILPNNPNNKINVVFNSFSLEADYDYLYMYDGDSPSATPIATFTGTTTPLSYTSTAANGSLTFKFVSDELVTGAGWNANINCMALGNNAYDYIDFTQNFNPKTQNLNIMSSNQIETTTIFAIDGKTIYKNILPQTNPAIDLSEFASGIYIVKIMILDKTMTFKIKK